MVISSDGRFDKSRIGVHVIAEPLVPLHGRGKLLLVPELPGAARRTRRRGIGEGRNCRRRRKGERKEGKMGGDHELQRLVGHFEWIVTRVVLV